MAGYDSDQLDLLELFSAEPDAIAVNPSKVLPRDQSPFDQLPEDVLLLILLPLGSLGSLFTANRHFNHFISSHCPTWFLHRFGPNRALLNLIGYGGQLCTPAAIDQLLEMGASFSALLAQKVFARYTGLDQSDTIVEGYVGWGRSQWLSVVGYAHVMLRASGRFKTLRFADSDDSRMKSACDLQILCLTSQPPAGFPLLDSPLRSIIELLRDRLWGSGYPCDVWAFAALVQLAGKETDLDFFLALEHITFTQQDLSTIVPVRLQPLSNAEEVLEELAFLQKHLNPKQNKPCLFTKDVLNRLAYMPVCPAVVEALHILDQRGDLSFDIRTWICANSRSPIQQTESQLEWYLEICNTFGWRTFHDITYLLTAALHLPSFGFRLPNPLPYTFTADAPWIPAAILSDVYFSASNERIDALVNHIKAFDDPEAMTKFLQASFIALFRRPDSGNIISYLIQRHCLEGHGKAILREVLLDHSIHTADIVVTDPDQALFTSLGIGETCRGSLNTSWYKPKDKELEKNIDLSLYHQKPPWFILETSEELGKSLYDIFQDDVEALEVLFQHYIFNNSTPEPMLERFFHRGLHLTGEHLDICVITKKISIRKSVWQDALTVPYVKRRTKDNCRPRKRWAGDLDEREALGLMDTWRTQVTLRLDNINKQHCAAYQLAMELGHSFPVRMPVEYSLRGCINKLDRRADSLIESMASRQGKTTLSNGSKSRGSN